MENKNGTEACRKHGRSWSEGMKGWVKRRLKVGGGGKVKCKLLQGVGVAVTSGMGDIVGGV